MSRCRLLLRITGASSEEDLDEQEVERYMRFLSHPLEINSASRSRLLSSGLLTRYQVASLEEYRSVYGDVLSFSELSLVDGFGEEITRRSGLSYPCPVTPCQALRLATQCGQDRTIWPGSLINQEIPTTESSIGWRLGDGWISLSQPETHIRTNC